MHPTGQHLPTGFLTQMREQLGSEYSDFVAALQEAPPTSLHHNPLKPLELEVAHSEKVKWYERGVYLPRRPVFTLDPAFHAGAYYVQEASSMFVAYAVRQTMTPDRPLRVLDLCAAPGGKSTLLASVLPPDALLVSNEVIRSRYQVLDYNLTKWGSVNTVVTNHDPRDFAGLGPFFDLILIDAPCSGEGLFRKDAAAVEAWSAENVALCSARQRRILAEAVPLLRSGGVLLYSTCTYNDSENRDNVNWVIDQFGLQALTLEIPSDWQLAARGPGYQFYPHRVQGEGFYLAALRKETGMSSDPYAEVRSGKRAYEKPPKAAVQALSKWIDPKQDLLFRQTENGRIIALPQQWQPSILDLSNHLRRLRAGTPLGIFKGRDFVPDAALALSTLLSSDVPAVSVDRSTALRFLKKETFELDNANGWQVVRYQGLNLGWVKALKNRINNYYPKNWRIRMDIDV